MIGKGKLDLFFKGDRDWQNVLNYWKQCHRMGLTIHALATITGRDPHVLLKEMRAEGHVGAQICHAICAPIFCWYRTRHPIFDFYDRKTREGLVEVNKGHNLSWAWQLSEVLLKVWPWPKYKGIKNWHGLTRVGEGISRPLLLRLKEAARGIIIP